MTITLYVEQGPLLEFKEGKRKELTGYHVLLQGHSSLVQIHIGLHEYDLKPQRLGGWLTISHLQPQGDVGAEQNHDKFKSGFPESY